MADTRSNKAIALSGYFHKNIVFPNAGMASFYLGPESPRPFSVLSESHLRTRLVLPDSVDRTFGAEYESRICDLINIQLEFDPDDRVCYVGSDDDTKLISALQRRFCLLQPITSVVPGHVLYAESQRLHRRMPVKVSHVGAQEYFRQTASSSQTPPFDKIVLKDAIAFLETPQETFKHIAKLLPAGGRLLIIERPAPILTLPVFRDAMERAAETERPYSQTIEALQSCDLDVRWSVESLPVVTSRLSWLAMLRSRIPSHLLNATSDMEIVAGLRELSEGSLKYGGDTLQFVDRLLFIAATTVGLDDCHVDRKVAPRTDNQLRYHNMPVTSDIQSCLDERKLPKRNRNMKSDRLRNNYSSSD